MMTVILLEQQARDARVSMTAIYRCFPRYLGESNGQSHLSTTQEHSTLLSEQRAETERLSVENSVLIYLNQGKLSCDLDRASLG